MPRDYYSIQLPSDWEKTYDDGGYQSGDTGLVVFESPGIYADVSIFTYFAEFGWTEDYNVDLKTTRDLSLKEDEPSYRTVDVWRVSTTTKRSSYEYDGEGSYCDIEGHGLHILTENYSYFVRVEICTGATRKFDEAFVESIFASFSYQE